MTTVVFGLLPLPGSDMERIIIFLTLMVDDTYHPKGIHWYLKARSGAWYALCIVFILAFMLTWVTQVLGAYHGYKGFEELVLPDGGVLGADVWGAPADGLVPPSVPANHGSLGVDKRGFSIGGLSKTDFGYKPGPHWTISDDSPASKSYGFRRHSGKVSSLRAFTKVSKNMENQKSLSPHLLYPQVGILQGSAAGASAAAAAADRRGGPHRAGGAGRGP